MRALDRIINKICMPIWNCVHDIKASMFGTVPPISRPIRIPFEVHSISIDGECGNGCILNGLLFNSNAMHSSTLHIGASVFTHIQMEERRVHTTTQNDSNVTTCVKKKWKKLYRFACDCFEMSMIKTNEVDWAYQPLITNRMTARTAKREQHRIERTRSDTSERIFSNNCWCSIRRQLIWPDWIHAMDVQMMQSHFIQPPTHHTSPLTHSFGGIHWNVHL